MYPLLFFKITEIFNNHNIGTLSFFISPRFPKIRIVAFGVEFSSKRDDSRGLAPKFSLKRDALRLQRLNFPLKRDASLRAFGPQIFPPNGILRVFFRIRRLNLNFKRDASRPLYLRRLKFYLQTGRFESFWTFSA